MKAIYFIIFLIICPFVSFSQMLDKRLDKYQNTIVDFLREQGEISNSEKSNYYTEFLISGEIGNLGPNTKVFRIGITSTHSKQYLGILNSKELKLFPTKNFDIEFDLIFEVLHSSKLRTSNENLLKCIKNIKSLYLTEQAKVPTVIN